MKLSALHSRTKRTGFFAILLISLAIPVLAQRDDDVVRVDTDLASFEVTVTDKDGKPVRNLDAKDFRVIEDGIHHSIDFFQPIKKQDASRPLSVVFALDVSGSMTPQVLERLRSAMDAFIKKLADYNSYFAITTFGMDVTT